MFFDGDEFNVWTDLLIKGKGAAKSVVKDQAPVAKLDETPPVKAGKSTESQLEGKPKAIEKTGADTRQSPTTGLNEGGQTGATSNNQGHKQSTAPTKPAQAATTYQATDPAALDVASTKTPKLPGAVSPTWTDPKAGTAGLGHTPPGAIPVRSDAKGNPSAEHWAKRNIVGTRNTYSKSASAIGHMPQTGDEFNDSALQVGRASSLVVHSADHGFNNKSGSRGSYVISHSDEQQHKDLVGRFGGKDLGNGKVQFTPEQWHARMNSVHGEAYTAAVAKNVQAGARAVFAYMPRELLSDKALGNYNTKDLVAHLSDATKHITGGKVTNGKGEFHLASELGKKLQRSLTNAGIHDPHAMPHMVAFVLSRKGWDGDARAALMGQFLHHDNEGDTFKVANLAKNYKAVAKKCEKMAGSGMVTDKIVSQVISQHFGEKQTFEGTAAVDKQKLDDRQKKILEGQLSRLAEAKKIDPNIDMATMLKNEAAAKPARAAGEAKTPEQRYAEQVAALRASAQSEEYGLHAEGAARGVQGQAQGQAANATNQAVQQQQAASASAGVTDNNPVNSWSGIGVGQGDLSHAQQALKDHGIDLAKVSPEARAELENLGQTHAEAGKTGAAHEMQWTPEQAAKMHEIAESQMQGKSPADKATLLAALAHQAHAQRSSEVPEQGASAAPAAISPPRESSPAVQQQTENGPDWEYSKANPANGFYSQEQLDNKKARAAAQAPAASAPEQTQAAPVEKMDVLTPEERAAKTTAASTEQDADATLNDALAVDEDKRTPEQQAVVAAAEQETAPVAAPTTAPVPDARTEQTRQEANNVIAAIGGNKDSLPAPEFVPYATTQERNEANARYDVANPRPTRSDINAPHARVSDAKILGKWLDEREDPNRGTKWEAEQKKNAPATSPEQAHVETADKALFKDHRIHDRVEAEIDALPDSQLKSKIRNAFMSAQENAHDTTGRMDKDHEYHDAAVSGMGLINPADHGADVADFFDKALKDAYAGESEPKRNAPATRPEQAHIPTPAHAPAQALVDTTAASVAPVKPQRESKKSKDKKASEAAGAATGDLAVQKHNDANQSVTGADISKPIGETLNSDETTPESETGGPVQKWDHTAPDYDWDKHEDNKAAAKKQYDERFDEESADQMNALNNAEKPKIESPVAAEAKTQAQANQSATGAGTPATEATNIDAPISKLVGETNEAIGEPDTDTKSKNKKPKVAKTTKPKTEEPADGEEANDSDPEPIEPAHDPRKSIAQNVEAKDKHKKELRAWEERNQESAFLKPLGIKELGEEPQPKFANSDNPRELRAYATAHSAWRNHDDTTPEQIKAHKNAVDAHAAELSRHKEEATKAQQAKDKAAAAKKPKSKILEMQSRLADLQAEQREISNVSSSKYQRNRSEMEELESEIQEHEAALKKGISIDDQQELIQRLLAQLAA